MLCPPPQECKLGHNRIMNSCLETQTVRMTMVATIDTIIVFTTMAMSMIKFFPINRNKIMNMRKLDPPMNFCGGDSNQSLAQAMWLQILTLILSLTTRTESTTIETAICKGMMRRQQAVVQVPITIRMKIKMMRMGTIIRTLKFNLHMNWITSRPNNKKLKETDLFPLCFHKLLFLFVFE